MLAMLSHDVEIVPPALRNGCKHILVCAFSQRHNERDKHGVFFSRFTYTPADAPRGISAYCTGLVCRKDAHIRLTGRGLPGKKGKAQNSLVV